MSESVPIRKGEPESVHFRSERFECVNGKWFFEIREEDRPLGPFESKEQAHRAANAYIEDIQAGRSPVSALSNQFIARAFSTK